MQFIAEDPVHVVVRNATPAVVDPAGRGLIRAEGRRLFAKFTRGLAPEWAREVGDQTFGFKKMPEGVTSGQWLSFYDSREVQAQLGWTDEERDAIEAKLQTIEGVIVVDKPRLAPPWPAYDRIVAAKDGLSNAQVIEKIAGKVTEDGYDPAAVIAYELENRKRKSVLAALQELAGPPPASTAELEEEEELVEA